jgi:hypothetical protein
MAASNFERLEDVENAAQQICARRVSGLRFWRGAEAAENAAILARSHTRLD